MKKTKTTRWFVLAGGLAAAALSYPTLARADGEAKEAKEAKNGIAFEAGAPVFVDVLSKAKAASKPVFLDFFTEW